MSKGPCARDSRPNLANVLDLSCTVSAAPANAMSLGLACSIGLALIFISATIERQQAGLPFEQQALGAVAALLVSICLGAALVTTAGGV